LPSFQAAKVHQSGQYLLAERANQYVTDGAITPASLIMTLDSRVQRS
jgi:hypothetical protein